MGSCLVRLSFDFDFVAWFFWPPFWVWEPFVKHWHLTFVGVFDFGEKVWCRLTEIYIFLTHCCRLLCNFCYVPAELEPTSIWLGAQLWEYPKFLWCQLCGHLKWKQVMYIEEYWFLIYSEGDFACFIISTIDGAASVLWRKLTVDACSLQIS